MRVIIVFVILAILFASPLLVFGDRFDRRLGGQEGVAWLREFGAWAGIIGIGLQCADLVLPIPATGIMAAMGIIYGVVVGGLLASAGSFMAGAVAYGLTRMIGERAAMFLIGERDLQRARRFFDQAGGWAVAMSRWMPLLPEVIASLAGLTRMDARRFFLALMCGSLPMGFAFAALGAWGSDRPLTAVVVSALLPLALWPVGRRLIGK